jgi:hypothetical protein
MKKVILTAVLASAAIASMNASAASGTAVICTGGSTAGSGNNVTTATDTFVKVSFSPKCSANVHAVDNDQNTYYGVGSASTKGKTAWVGSTAGGGISKNADCAATGCTSTNAQDAASAAPSS